MILKCIHIDACTSRSDILTADEGPIVLVHRTLLTHLFLEDIQLIFKNFLLLEAMMQLIYIFYNHPPPLCENEPSG